MLNSGAHTLLLIHLIWSLPVFLSPYCFYNAVCILSCRLAHKLQTHMQPVHINSWCWCWWWAAKCVHVLSRVATTSNEMVPCLLFPVRGNRLPFWIFNSQCSIHGDVQYKVRLNAVVCASLTVAEFSTSHVIKSFYARVMLWNNCLLSGCCKIWTNGYMESYSTWH